jgi:hypothetical protein
LVALGSAVVMADKIAHADGWQTASPRRSVVARVIWLDDAGKRVLYDHPMVSNSLPDFPPTAEPEYPTDKATDPDGWTEVSDTYQALSKAARGKVERSNNRTRSCSFKSGKGVSGFKTPDS